MQEHDLTTSRLGSQRPAWVDVDLEALTRNLARVKTTVSPSRVAAVVKADAYGHGAVDVSRALESAGVELLAVTIPEEGRELRQAGIQTPILVLGAHMPSQVPLLVEFDLIPTISTAAQLRAWSSLPGAATRSVHLKVDTGMNRLGFTIEELPAVLDHIRHATNLELTGLLSHFVASNEPEAAINTLQEKRWHEIDSLLTAEERERTVRHIANSAAALHHPWSRLDMVRTGLAIYGLDPADRSAELEPVMSVRARIIQVRHLATGSGVGYNHRWRAERDSRIGVLPLGYADGYHWRLGNRARALAGHQRVEIIGNVSMDMTAIDLTESDRGEGDEITLLGSSGDVSITAFDLAEWAGTIPYEILVSFGLRLPRVYVRP